MRSLFKRCLMAFLGVLVLLISISALAFHPSFRFSFDMTKSRAYTLSPQTKDLINRLEGNWQMTLILGKRDVSSSVLSQIDEVSRRFHNESQALNVQRLDPSEPSDLMDLDKFLAEIESSEAEERVQYQSAIEEGIKKIEHLEQLAGEVGVLGASLLERVSINDPINRLRIGCESLKVLAGSKGNLRKELKRKTSLTEAAPLPDIEGAANWLEMELRRWALQVDEIASEMFVRRPGESSIQIAQFVNRWGKPLELEARNLLNAAESISKLPPLKATEISKKLSDGPVAVVVGPTGIAAVGSDEWLGRVNQKNEDQISFDRRFRGEQVLAAAIRRIIDPRNIRVVIVHIESNSPLKLGSKRDLVALQEWTRGGGFDWLEWDPRKTVRPVFDSGKTIWLILGPPAKPTLGQDDFDDKKLRQATRRLLEEGESIFITLSPSVLPQYGEPDPWAVLLSDLVKVNSGQVLFERIPQINGNEFIRRAVTLRNLDSHPIGQAIDGTRIDWPLGIEIKGVDGITSNPIMTVAPSSRKWLESNWMQKDFDSYQLRDFLKTPVVLMRSVERISPIGIGTQRVLVGGSTGWLLSSIAGRVVNSAGDKEVLLSPGNMALAEASFLWLARMDDRLLAGPLTRQAARVQNVTEFEWRVVAFIFVLLLPVIFLCIGLRTAWRKS